MGRLFDPDNAFFQFIGLLADMVTLSVLWVVCSIPVFTLGASTTALYYTAHKVMRYRRGYVIREFFGAFKSNFKQSTAIWCLGALILGGLYLDMRIIAGGSGMTSQILKAFFLVVGLYVLAILIYALTYTARFESTVGETLKNAVLLTMMNFPRSILALAAVVAAGLVIYIFIPGFLAAPCLCGLLLSYILEPVYKKIMSPEELAKENIRNYPEQYEYFDRGHDENAPEEDASADDQ